MELMRAASVVTIFVLSSVLAVCAAEPKADTVGLGFEASALNEAVTKIQAIAGEIEALARGEADAERVAERLAGLRDEVRTARERWRYLDDAVRNAARESDGENLTEADERLAAAVGNYAGGPARDQRILRLLRETPAAQDFMRDPTPRTYQGIYRSGFDSSDFYLFDGEGPWWLEPSGEAFEELQSYLVERPGRGSSVTVSVTFSGWIESEGGYGPLKQHERKIHAERIEHVRPITETEYWTAVGLTRERAGIAPRTR